MLGTTDINKLFAGIDKYAKFYGYNKIRTIANPSVGENPLAQMHIYKGMDVELLVKVDKVEEKWIVRAVLLNGLGDTVWEKELESSKGDLDNLAKDVEIDILKKIPRNHTEGSRVEESAFLDNFIKSSLYIIEAEYQELFKGE